MSFSQNRFNALLGDEETEVDKLGNVKPVEKKNDQPPTRRELRKTGQRQPAVSPPSRRGHRSNNKNEGDNNNLNIEAPQETTRPPREKPGRWEGRGRQFDRHSGTGIYDNEKKVNQGWGKAGASEYEGAHDVLDPNDPDAAETRPARVEEPEENTKTLEEYLAEKKDSAKKFRLDQGRKANEGSDESQWKNTVELKKEETSYFSGKETETKLKSKNKKEKVYLEIDQPAHRSSNDRRGGRGGGRGGRGGRNQREGRQNREQNSVNLSDSKAFPTLGA